jgi:hypothetical protein
MSDVTIDKWKQQGNLYLWKYLENARNYPGWHMTANRSACQNLADLIEKMLSSPWSSQKVLNTEPPNEKILQVPNNRGGKAHWEAAQSLILKYPKKHKVTDDSFLLKEYKNTVELSLGKNSLELLRQGILEIPEGKGDYTIGTDEIMLWFWWMPE